MHYSLPALFEVVPYLLQAVIYGVAFRYSRLGAHLPSQAYLASCVLHLALALRKLF